MQDFGPQSSANGDSSPNQPQTLQPSYRHHTFPLPIDLSIQLNLINP
jgi:hypothetical protein